MPSTLYKTWLDDSQCRYFAKVVWEHVHQYPEDKPVAIRIVKSIVNRRNLDVTSAEIEKAFVYFKQEVVDAIGQRGKKKAYIKSAKRVGITKPTGTATAQK